MKRALIILALTGCGLFRSAQEPPRVPKVVVREVFRACLKTAPPDPPKLGARGEKCMPGKICWARDDAGMILFYLQDLEGWARDAWNLCKPMPAPEGKGT